MTEQLTTLDQIVTVGCALVNVCDGIIPEILTVFLYFSIFDNTMILAVACEREMILAVACEREMSIDSK